MPLAHACRFEWAALASSGPGPAPRPGPRAQQLLRVVTVAASRWLRDLFPTAEVSSPAALLELCRGGAMTARRALLVERAFGILTRRLGTDHPPASKLASALPNAPVALAPPPPTRALFLEAVGGPRQRVDFNTFRAFFEDLSPAIEGDAAFARLLANAWDVAAWPASGEDVAEDEVPEPDADDDGQRGPVEDRYYTSGRQ